MKPAAAEAKKIKALEALTEKIDAQGLQITALIGVVTELTATIEKLRSEPVEDEPDKKPVVTKK